MTGLDVLGAIVGDFGTGGAPSVKPDLLLTLKVHNPGELAKKQADGGFFKAGAIALDTLNAPALEAEVYKGIAEQMPKEFAARGGNVTVKVVDAASLRGAAPVLLEKLSAARSLLPVAGVGVVLGGVVSWLIFRRKR